MKTIMRIDTALAALCVLKTLTAEAQVPPPPLSGVRVDATVTVDPATKIYTFQYSVTNPSQNVLPISSVAVDITLPANSIRPTGSTKLPAGPRFHDPDGPTGFPVTKAYPYGTHAAYFQAVSGLNFVPIGLSSTNGWARYSVTPTDATCLQGVVIDAVWSGHGSKGELTPISPGQSLGGFVLTSFGLPGIRTMELQPSLADVIDLIPPEWQGKEEDSTEVFNQKERLVNSLGYLASTLGPTALPRNYTNPVLVTRLQGYVDQSASLSWITDPALVQQLTGLLTQTTAALQQNQPATAKTLLQQFITAITSASLTQRRQEASDLLSLNAQFIVDNITVPVVTPQTALLSPESAQQSLNGTQTMTLTVSRMGVFAGVDVVADILTGPNAGKHFAGVTDANGQWTFSWVGRAEGVDSVLAQFTPKKPPGHLMAGETRFLSAAPCDPGTVGCYDSNVAIVTWSGGPDLTLGHLYPPALKLPDPTNSVTIDETTVNIGTAAAPPSKTRYYLSTNQVLDASAIMLGERDVPSLQPNEVSASTGDFTIPSLADGIYWIMACADGAVQVAELDKTNNCQALEASVVHVVDAPPGCAPFTATINPSGPTTFCPGGSVTLTASQGTSWLWSNGATTQSIPVSQSGSYSVTVTASPGCTATSDPLTVTVADTQPPTITACPAGKVLSAGPACQAPVPDLRSGIQATDNCTSPAGLAVSQSPAPGTLVGLGVTPVTFTVADAAGNVATCSSTLSVVDTTPPAITNPTASPSSLWPPNHKMVDLTVDYGLSDNCAGAVASSLSISCNEPVNGGGDGNTSVDWQVVDAHNVQLRAERSGTGSGRIYTVTITARDAAGNISTAWVPVTVSHNE